MISIDVTYIPIKINELIINYHIFKKIKKFSNIVEINEYLY